ncbi:MAG: hypothetical protein JXR97_02960 [Planctomycetes bacterium]|nr:hypothetical protein [Planctomycetota bacterium]
MSHVQAESRDDVMSAFSLKSLLTEKTATEFSSRWEKTHPKPAIGSAILTFVLAIALSIFGAKTPATIFWVLTLGQVIWVAVVFVLRMTSSIGEKREMIRQGIFPPESATLVFNRLRWWNHLIVPQHWARHSRIHDRKYKLEKRVQELEKAIGEYEEEEEDKKEKLETLEHIDIPALAAKINTWAQRMDYEARIATLESELERLNQEYSLYQALLHKVKLITDKLERIEKLGVKFQQNGDQQDLNEIIESAVMILEQRRNLVQQVDQITPSQFLELIKVQSNP